MMRPSDELFEVVNLRPSRTGLSSTIQISTRRRGVQPSVRLFLFQINDTAPHFRVSIEVAPRVLAVRSVTRRQVLISSPSVIRWVGLNHEKLQLFWDEGVTWFSDEVARFERSLERLPDSPVRRDR